MILAADYVRSFIEGLEFPILVTGVTESGSTTEFTTLNTQYITTINRVKINGTYYTVTEFVKDESFTIKGTGLGITGGDTIYLPAPTFFHGQFMDTNLEVSDRGDSGDPDRREFMPMVYMIEPVKGLSVPSDPNSRFQLEGQVRLFLLNDTTWTNRPDDHYRLDSNPLAAIIGAMEDGYIEHFKVTDRIGINGVIVHPKFIARTNPEPLEDESKMVFGRYLSGVEVWLDCPIVSCNC